VNLTAKDIERFWGKVDRRGPDECWPWTASRSSGYGWFGKRYGRSGRGFNAHRVVCYLTYGDPKGRYALHSCDNAICCNPAHLRWGTPAENMQDRSARGNVPVGSAHKLSRLTEDAVREIRARVTNGEARDSLASEFGVSVACIGLVVTRKGWRHVV
jgi:hypothetical protein